MLLHPFKRLISPIDWGWKDWVVLLVACNQLNFPNLICPVLINLPTNHKSSILTKNFLSASPRRTLLWCWASHPNAVANCGRLAMCSLKQWCFSCGKTRKSHEISSVPVIYLMSGVLNSSFVKWKYSFTSIAAFLASNTWKLTFEWSIPFTFQVLKDDLGLVRLKFNACFFGMALLSRRVTAAKITWLIPRLFVQVFLDTKNDFNACCWEVNGGSLLWIIRY